jgi:hypothetical protein
MAILIMCVLAIGLRFVPHMPNVVPMAAMALYAGSCMDKRFAAWVPLALYIVTDLIVGMHDAVLFTWGSIMLISLVGMRLPKFSMGTALGGTIAGTLAFFAITNFGVWMVGIDHTAATPMYPHTAAGLVACYVSALPFLVNSLLGNTVFIGALMAVRSLVAAQVKEERTRFAFLLG